MLLRERNYPMQKAYKSLKPKISTIYRYDKIITFTQYYKLIFYKAMYKYVRPCTIRTLYCTAFQTYFMKIMLYL